MKKLWFIVVALALYAGPAAAQGKEKYKEKGGRREMAGAGWQQYMDSLNLTAEQRTRIATINDTYRQRMDSLRNANLGEADMRTQRETLMRQHMDEVHAVLTDEQRTRLEAMRPAGGGRMGADGMGPGMMGGGPGGNLNDLNLTQDQKNRVAAINQEFRQKMTDLRNENLSQDEMRTRREALQQQHMESIRGVLTDEQRAKWNAGMNNNDGNKKIKEKGDKYKEKTKS